MMRGGPMMMGGPAPLMGGPPMGMGGPRMGMGGMMGPPQGMQGPALQNQGFVEGPPGEVAGPSVLLATNEKPDDVTYKEFYCTVCKKQMDNEDEFLDHNNSEEHALAEANQEVYTCRLCKTNLTSTLDFNMHCDTQKHLQNMAAKQERDHLRAMGQFVPDSEDEEEDEEKLLPEPIPDEGEPQRTRMSPWHCGFCNLWFPTITILRFYHSVSEKHLAAVRNAETVGTPTCIICKASGDTAANMIEKCLTRQKMKILGPHRQFSCDMCDVHLSEQEWLDNHFTGEKHMWVVDRVEKLLPVQFIPLDMVVVQKSQVNAYTGVPEFWQEFRCVICKVGFSPIDRYKKHTGSLFHLRKSAGEDIKWIDGMS